MGGCINHGLAMWGSRNNQESTTLIYWEQI